MARRNYNRRRHESPNPYDGGHRFVARGSKASGLARKAAYDEEWAQLAEAYSLGEMHERCTQGHHRKGCTPCFERGLVQAGIDIAAYKRGSYWPRRRATIMQRWKKIGITQGTYEEMWEAQEGRCALCGEEETAQLAGVVKELAVDHSHETGKIRGLLCQRCNLALGFVEKLGLEWMRTVAMYLREHMSEEERERFVKQKSKNE